MSETRKTVLIVDDEPDMLRVLELGLRAEGYRTVAASSGREAVGLADAHQPDVILLDVMLPDLDGGAVAAALAESPRTAGIPIIFLTALISKQEAQRYHHTVGRHTTLAKPYEMRELVAQIERSLAQAASMSR